MHFYNFNSNVICNISKIYSYKLEHSLSFSVFGVENEARRATVRIDISTLIPFNLRDFLRDPAVPGPGMSPRIVTMHHLVALGGSVLQGCLNLRDHGRGIQWMVQT